MALACFPRAPAWLLAAVKHAQVAWLAMPLRASLLRPPALAVVRQDDVDHGLPSVIVLMVTLMSPSSPVCGWAGLPQPLSSKACAADTRAVVARNDGIEVIRMPANHAA